MKKLILTSICLFSINSFANLTGPQDLSCKLQQMEPENYEATIKGPSKTGKYELVFMDSYYGYTFKNKYSLIAKSTIELSSAKASVKEINIINGHQLIEIKTDKDGPITLICE